MLKGTSSNYLIVFGAPFAKLFTGGLKHQNELLLNSIQSTMIEQNLQDCQTILAKISPIEFDTISHIRAQSTGLPKHFRQKIK